MTQNDRQGGSSGKARPMTENDQVSKAEKLKFVLGQLVARREEIEAVLPPDIPFDHFYAVANQAIRNNPDVLEATPLSIVNACVKSAYDGLRLDGREAALVTHRVKAGKNPDRWESQAQYFPMVFGLIQQVLRGGEIIAMEPDIIYANDEYRVQKGTNPGIHHVPNLEGDRGKPIAAYSVATYKTGHIGFELMTEAQILDVRAASKSGQDQQGNATGIWKRWPGAMWKKTVIRQHRKTLPLGGRDIYDAEAREEFEALGASDPQQRVAPPKPARTNLSERAQALLGDNSAEGSGVPLNLGETRERDGVLIDGGGGEPKAATKNQELPEDDAAWSGWAADVERRVLAGNVGDITAIQREEHAQIAAASPERADFIKSLITDRLADLASDAAAEQASDGEG